MAFQFSLETVLRFRRTTEKREYLRLQMLLAKRAAMLQELERLEQVHLRLEREWRQSLAHGMSAAEIQLTAQRSRGAVQVAERMRAQIRETEIGITQQGERYRAERTRADGLQLMRDNRWRDYMLAEQRRQQALLDELYVLRKSNGRCNLPT